MYVYKHEPGHLGKCYNIAYVGSGLKKEKKNRKIKHYQCDWELV
jgi:hypothetical protein